MGLTNVKLMIPFCRTVEESKHVLAELATHGLQQGQYGLEVYVMCEIPSNVILAADFANGAITPCQYGVYAGVIPPKRSRQKRR